jgi:hypothetical protein
MKAYGGVEVYIHIFLSSSLVGGECSASRSDRFNPRRNKKTGTHWIGGWVGSKAGLDDMEMRKFLTLPGLHPGTSVPTTKTLLTCYTHSR